MTQTTSETWCARIQAKLMAAIDAAWAMIEASDDPAVLRKARDKVKACGELAANVRKIAAMSGQRRPAPRAAAHWAGARVPAPRGWWCPRPLGPRPFRSPSP